MMRVLYMLMALVLFANADISTTTNKSKNLVNTKRDSKQLQNQTSRSENKTVGKGKEVSSSRQVTSALSKISSINHTATRGINGSWSIALNPIPYIFMELRALGWNKKSFWLTQDDIGTLNYIEDEDEEFGELQNVNKLEVQRNRAAYRGKLSKKQVLRLQKYINLLYYTGKIVEKTTRLLQKFPNSLDIVNFENSVRKALIKAYKQTRVKYIHVHKCNYGGDINSYVCDDGRFTLVLTHGVPNLLVNGAPFYTATSIGFTTPSLNISFATNTNEAFSYLTQDTKSNSIAGMVRDYTNKLEQRGENKIAMQIKNKFVEKTLSNSLTATSGTVVNAINSGSPISVLRLFK